MELLIFQFINGLANKYLWLDTLGVFFAKYLAYLMLFVLLVMVVGNFKKYSKTALLALTAGIFSEVFVQLIRLIWHRPRPFVGHKVNLLLHHSLSGSFPSGHAAFFFALSAVIYFYNKGLGYLFFILSALMGIARVFTGVHWLSDILGGAALGIASGFVCYKYFLKSKNRS
jgi:undecaprenyl-diphosphatase